MLLTEYDEQAHIESEREIAKEEGREENQRRMCDLIQKMVEAGKDNQLAKLSDPVFLQEMFEYFQI